MAALDPKTASAISQDGIDFFNASPTHFHNVAECARRLRAAGFGELSERDPWALVPGGKYFYTRNGSTIVAFGVGGQYERGNGFTMVGGHTDSPCIKLKPVSTLTKGGLVMLNVTGYGGGLWHTWFDRDLTLAGRVLVEKDGKVEVCPREREDVASSLRSAPPNPSHSPLP